MASENRSHNIGQYWPGHFEKIAIFTAIILWCLLCQPLVSQNAPDLTGNWQGTVEAGRGFRVILQISQADQRKGGKGAWQGILYSMGPGGTRQSDVSLLTLEGTMLRFTISPDGNFEGKLGTDGRSIAGTLKQGAASYALTLAHASADTAWAVPDATTHMPPGATPEFEVATIKPTGPSRTAVEGFHVKGRRIYCDNQTVRSIISIAYGVREQQIVGGPTWLATDKYDVDGVPDLAGQPNLEQMWSMYRSLLASRFSLALHHETRELSVYALRVEKNGAKLAKSLGDPKDLPDQTITNWTSQLIELKETNATLAEFSQMMGMVLDKPVADQTGLSGRLDFTLRWTPEGAQITDANAPPGLFTAIREQLGLKLEATKAPIDVLVIDHIDRPSPN